MTILRLSELSIELLDGESPLQAYRRLDDALNHAIVAVERLKKGSSARVREATVRERDALRADVDALRLHLTAQGIQLDTSATTPFDIESDRGGAGSFESVREM